MDEVKPVFFLNLLMSFFEIWKKCASISDERIVSSEHMRPNFSVINGFLTKRSAKCNFKNFDFGAFYLTIKNHFLYLMSKTSGNICGFAILGVRNFT